MVVAAIKKEFEGQPVEFVQLEPGGTWYARAKDVAYLMDYKQGSINAITYCLDERHVVVRPAPHPAGRVAYVSLEGIMHSLSRVKKKRASRATTIQRWLHESFTSTDTVNLKRLAHELLHVLETDVGRLDQVMGELKVAHERYKQEHRHLRLVA